MILIVIGILILLVLLISWAKIHPFLAFLIVSLVAALSLGLAPNLIGKSLQKGIGDILGPVFAVICLGAMLGKIIASSGAAQKISEALVGLFGTKNLSWALALTGFIVGIPLFYNVGFILLIPLIYSLSQRYKLPLVYMAVCLCSALSVTHGFLPPHPSPTAIVPMMGANLGQTLILGLIASIPIVILAGPIFARTVKNIVGTPLATLKVETLAPERLPSAWISFGCALLPVVLLAWSTWINSTQKDASVIKSLADIIADPAVVMLISVFVAYYFLGIRRSVSMKSLMGEGLESMKDVFPILLIVAGAGALKEILLAAGISTQLAEIMKGSSLSPLIMGWLTAALIRLSLGSATVAGLTAAGLLAPSIDPTIVNPNLMVLSIGAGSLLFSHVNDTGFWMFKEYFGLSIKDTIRSWSLMETVVSVAGLLMILLMNQFM